MSAIPPGTSARRLRLLGLEVVSHTTPLGDGGYRCYLSLADPRRPGRSLRIVGESGGTPVEAERQAVTAARRLLAPPGPQGATRRARGPR